MKCLVVMSSLPDILFFWADQEFTDHLNVRSMEIGLIDKDYSDSSVDINAALQYFSPLVASQRYMNDVNNPYSSITCANGMVIVIDQKDDFVYLVLNGDGEESEEFLKRKLRVFRYLTSFHFGPCTDHLKADSAKLRKEIWACISSVLETYCFLCTQQQGFLVEANEMIQVNKFLSEKTIGLLEQVIRKAQKEGDPQAKHALLLVNSKVLALYSSNQASKLQAPDIMMLTTLVHSKFTGPEQTIPISVNKTPCPLAFEAIRFEDVYVKPDTENIGSEDIDDDYRTSNYPYGEVRSSNLEIQVDESGSESNSEMFFSVGATLRDGSSQSVENSDHSSKENVSGSSVTSEKYYTPDEEAKFSEFYESVTSGTKSSKSRHETETNTESDKELYRQRIFLRPSRSLYVPHTVHCLQISPGTVLVIVSEVKKGELAKDMCSMISILSCFIEDKPASDEALNVPSTLEKMDGNIRKICDGFKGSTAMEKTLEDYLANIRRKWETVKANDFQGYLQNRASKRLPPKLDGLLVDMMKTLSNLFGFMFCSGKTFSGPAISVHHAKALHRIQEGVQKELEDYKSFLSVKAERNFTMTTYLEEFPGIIHFIYIDRTANRVTAPSINTDGKKIYNRYDPAHFIKQSIWDGWNYLRTFVVQGHTNISVRYADFLFSYVLWFEDSSGNQMNIKDPNAFIEEFAQAPGIIGSDFFSELKLRCFPALSQDKIYCYELFCVHLGILPLTQVAGHCRRLAALLWESSGEANLPMFLVG